MKISCNILKKHIKDSNNINWLEVWDKFTIRTAEVEAVEKIGYDITNVVVGQILTVEDHPKSEKLHILKVSVGDEQLQIVCGAPNVKEGLKTAVIKIGGTIEGITITARELVGVTSHGMCLSEAELGISSEHDGIIQLPEEYEVGKDIKEYMPYIEDIIVEIDNKSLTNRPDLWGHYGIAREISAISNSSLLPLELVEVSNDKNDLDIKVNSDICFRYTGVKLGNITSEQTPYWMKTFLHYAGMKSVSLLVDITNYIMLELGQPMHAFDATNFKNIEVVEADDKTEFTTLDKTKRTLSNEMLMIKNNNEYFAIAGVMGGLDSQVEDTTNEIILESATFEASSVRKTATTLGLRTEASSRYEKSLDPNLTIVATKRFINVLKSIVPNVSIDSNITDVYTNKLEEKVIKLTKKTLYKYMGKPVDSKIVIDIFNSLEFKTVEEEDAFVVTVPTYRVSKDISIEADLVEEVSRMYGYENFELTPLNLDLTFKVHENLYDVEDEIKRYLVSKFHLNEVHTYLWYKSSFLKEINVNKENVTLLEKSEDCILRDDLALSLVESASVNLKHTNKVGVFEIATVITNEEDNRALSIALADEDNNVELLYNKAKEIVYSLFVDLKNTKVDFVSSTSYEYNVEGYCLDILVENKVLGQINIVHPKIVSSLSKKKAIVTININFTEYVKLEDNLILYKEISKYQTVDLDYTINTSIDTKYETLYNVIKSFESNLINNYELRDIYTNEDVKKYTIRYNIGSYDETLTQEQLNEFKQAFIAHIRSNNYDINE